jgi:hypothetical protein
LLSFLVYFHVVFSYVVDLCRFLLLFSSGAIDLVPTSRLLLVDFYFGEGVHEVSIAFNSAESPLDTAARNISALPMVKAKRGVVLDGFSMKARDGGLVTTFASIPPNPETRLVFWQPERLTPLSACDWTSTQMEQLKINFTDVCSERDFFSDLPGLDVAVRPAAQKLQFLLEKVLCFFTASVSPVLCFISTPCVLETISCRP